MIFGKQTFTQPSMLIYREKKVKILMGVPYKLQEIKLQPRGLGAQLGKLLA